MPAISSFLGFVIQGMLIWYRLVVTGVASHISQFAAPCPALFRAERAALVIATSSPHDALGRDILCNAKQVGLSIQFASLTRLSAAAMLRISETTVLFHESVIAHDRLDDSDDKLVRPPLRAWISSSFFAELRANRDRLLAVPPVVPYLDDPWNIQSSA